MQIIRILIIQFSTDSHYYHTLRFKYILQTTLIHNAEETSHTQIKGELNYVSVIVKIYVLDRLRGETNPHGGKQAYTVNSYLKRKKKYK
jgi:hypothetical protein